MAHPISIRLEDDVRETLEIDAKERHVPLATYLRNIAEDRARELRRTRMREGLRQVAEHVKGSPEARNFIEEVGAPTAVLKRAGRRR